MALNIHKLENGQPQELLFSINEAAFSALLPAFERFKQATGLAIDPYKDLKLSSGLGPLIGAVEAKMPKEPKAAAIFKELLQVLQTAEASGQSIIFFGD